MLISVVQSVTSLIVRIKIYSQATAYPSGLTGLTSASAGLIIGTIADNEATTTAYTVAGSTIESISTLGTYAAPTATKCRFKEADATNHPGVYELQFANARYATGGKYLLISIAGTTTNLVQSDAIIQLVTFDPYSTTNAVGTATSVTGSVGSVTGAVGSVTGNVGGVSGVTFPATVASPTNITAGTITTVTNLTNAPTAGDLTATMKSSVATAIGTRTIGTAPTANTWDEAIAFAQAGIGKNNVAYTPPSGVNTANGVMAVKANDGVATLKTFSAVNQDASGNITSRA